MRSPLLALFIRSLREDSRLRQTYFARSFLILVILLFLLSIKTAFGWMNAPGREFFGTVTFINLAFIVLSAVSFFASAITEEKEEMTLGLLRMTNLNPLSILLGKSTSRLFTSTLLFLAQIPFTLLAITLGGVSLRQILAVYIALAAFLFFVANLALAASVICRRSATAGALVTLTLIGFFCLLPWSLWWVNLPNRLRLVTEPNSLVKAFSAFAQFFADASPINRLGHILDTRSTPSLSSFQAWSNLGMGIFFFLLAWGLFERCCDERAESAPGRMGVARARGGRRRLGPGRVWRLAPAWKDFHFTFGGPLWLLLKAVIYASPVVAWRFWVLQFNPRASLEELAGFTFWFAVAMVCLELALASASIFRVERQGQTLSSLAMLPQGIRIVAYQKLVGLVPSLTTAMIFMAIPLLTFGWKWVGNNSLPDASVFLMLFYCGTQALFLLHLTAFLSLHLKRGALPMGIAAFILTNMFLAVLGSLTHANQPDGFFIGFSLLFAAISGVLHFRIGARLEALAAEA